MRKIWLIARREYLYNFSRRSFLFTAFGVPAFSIVMVFVIMTFAEKAATETGQLGNVGYVDEVGFLADPVEKPEEYIAFPDAESANQAFLNGEIGAYFVVVPDFFTAGEVDAYAREGVPQGIEDQFSDFVKANLARLVPEGAPVTRILDPMEMQIVELDTGQSFSDPEALGGRLVVPFIFGFLFIMAVNTTSQFLMSGVVEEKENRMMEILVTSSTPLEMLWGKVLGLGALGLTQVGLWAVAGGLILNLQTDSTFLQGVSVPLDYLVFALVYIILGYFLFGAIMAGIGASVTAEQEGRQFAAIFTLVALLPWILIVTFMQDPNGTVPVVFSLIPITAPIAMLMRMPLASVPLWQTAVSLVLLLLAVMGTVWLAARIFRIGLLMYGKRLTLREIANAVRQGRKTMLTLAHEEGGAK